MSNLEQQIVTLQRRREQLQAKHGEAPIVGKTDFAARRAALDEVSAIDAQLADLETQLHAAQLQEARAAQIAHLVALASAGRAALADIEATHADLAQVLLPLLERYSDALQQQSAARTAFYDALADLAPEARSLRADQTSALAILAELDAAGADCTGVLVNLTSPIGRPLDRSYESSALFPGALHTALREEAARRLGHALPGDVFALPAEQVAA